MGVNSSVFVLERQQDWHLCNRLWRICALCTVVFAPRRCYSGRTGENRCSLLRPSATCHNRGLGFMSQSVAVPWKSEMRRVNRTGQGGVRVAEWMPPEGIVQQTRQHFLDVMRWGEKLPFMSPRLQTSSAPHFLAGTLLRRLHSTLVHEVDTPRALFAEVLRAEHNPEPRYYTPQGERCLIVDRQRERRMAVYDLRHDRRLFTQHLGAGVIVARMAYDVRDNRWKLESWGEELPGGWDEPELSVRMLDNTTFLAHLEHMAGRGLIAPIGRDL